MMLAPTTLIGVSGSRSAADGAPARRPWSGRHQRLCSSSTARSGEHERSGHGGGCTGSARPKGAGRPARRWWARSDGTVRFPFHRLGSPALGGRDVGDWRYELVGVAAPGCAAPRTALSRMDLRTAATISSKFFTGVDLDHHITELDAGPSPPGRTQCSRRACRFDFGRHREVFNRRSRLVRRMQAGQAPRTAVRTIKQQADDEVHGGSADSTASTRFQVFCLYVAYGLPGPVPTEVIRRCHRNAGRDRPSAALR